MSNFTVLIVISGVSQEEKWKFGKSLLGVPGLMNAYNGPAVEDAGVTVMVLQWQEQDFFVQYLDKSGDVFFGLIKEAEEKSGKPDQVYYAFMESHDIESKEDIYRAPVTEIATCKLKPEVNAEEFEKSFDQFRTGTLSNKTGDWGRVQGSSGHYVVLLPWQTIEESQKASEANRESEDGKAVTNLVESYHVHHVHFVPSSKPE